MPITQQQIQHAAASQSQAAHDTTAHVRLLAGPGTGKSRTIAERVNRLIATGATPNRIYVISFTRATVRDLKSRVVHHCTQGGTGPQSNIVEIRTMHSLALYALRQGNLLTMFPAGPTILDDWEQQNLFDKEYAAKFGCTPSRAKKIRLAHDAYWQTLQPTHLNQVNQQEQTDFLAFHSQFTTIYSSILPGEVVRRCVEAMTLGTLQAGQLNIEHLIVDEFQDFNACDQDFIRRIAAGGAGLWIAGDDDQSVYSFRHADSTGIQTFQQAFAGAASHTLADCFRCTPEVLAAGLRVIAFNPSPPRIQKALISLYANSAPPVQGRVMLWRQPTGADEARSIADSCAQLMANGIAGENILILLSNRRVQLGLLEDALTNANVPHSAPRGPGILEAPAARLVYALLRIVELADDYAAHRDLLELQNGVGIQTCLDIESATVAGGLNFRALFYAPVLSGVFGARSISAIQKVSQVCAHIQTWQPTDDLTSHDQALVQLMDHVFRVGSAAHHEATGEWNQLRALFPNGTQLQEVLAYLRADSEVGQLKVIESIYQRLNLPTTGGVTASNRVRVLTMHGAKGLEGHVVFIPGFEQELIPSLRSAAFAGSLQERRRLLYVSITRAKACCIVTSAQSRSGAGAQTLMGTFQYYPAPSQFLTELAVPIQNRTGGLTTAEVADIISDCSQM